ncbi:MAG: 23S rRNA (adenine(2503)-C(2))-methyltransferase RlmN [Phycisphaerales bacterium]
MSERRAHIFDFDPAALGAWCAARGMPAFRGKQILEWVYQRGVADPGLMSNLSKRDRAVLREEMDWLDGRVIAHQLASDETQKLLVQWSGRGGKGGAPEVSGGVEGGGAGGGCDALLGTLLAEGGGGAGGGGGGSGGGGGRVVGFDYERGDPSRQTECVMIPGESKESGRARRTACISSQIGCPVGCRFCASGLGGLDGNLTTGRIVEQVWRLDALLREGARRAGDMRGAGERRITHIVFMGMGEPLANFRNVVNAVRTLAAPWGMGISARRITVSTVGMHAAIEKLAEELELPVTLALSLHAPNDAIRRSLIPWAEYTSIDQLFGACDAWFRKTGREITLEYTLLRGVNDRVEHAEELSRVAKRLRANVNLIRWNEVGGLAFERPTDESVRRFQRVLRERGVNAHIRASRGRDIAAACGQLRHEGVGRAGGGARSTGLTVEGRASG